MVYLILACSIVFEVIGTTLMKKTEGFTVLLPSVGTVACYAISFFLISKVLNTIPVGIAYAIWSGVGIVLVSASSYFIYKQRLDLPALAGIALIISGVIVINLFSNSSAH